MHCVHLEDSQLIMPHIALHMWECALQCNVETLLADRCVLGLQALACLQVCQSQRRRRWGKLKLVQHSASKAYAPQRCIKCM